MSENDQESQFHIVLLVASALSTYVFLGQIAWLRKAGFRVTLICSSGPQTAAMKAEGAEVIIVPMEREISVFKDLVSLWRLWCILSQLRPDAITVATPKAGLLGGIAARLARVPHRIYALNGLRLETAAGWLRKVLTVMERISCTNAQHIRCVGPSLRQRAVDLGLVSPDKAYVVGQGSANGIDCDYYQRTPQRLAQAIELRRLLGIPVSAPVIGFVGRLTRDKGITELYWAFSSVRKDFPDLRLVIVGDFEIGDPVDLAVRQCLQTDSHVVLPGTVADLALYYTCMDLLALPSYREGLPTVVLEAQAAAVPVVTTTATGAVDSVLEGITGLLVAPGDVEALSAALREMLGNPEHRRRMGEAGANWVADRFRQEVVWQALVADYDRIRQIPSKASVQNDKYL